MNAERVFQPYGAAHLTVIVLTFVLPFVLAAFVRRSRWPNAERVIANTFGILLAANFLGYAIYLRAVGLLELRNALPFQLCDWAMVAIIVALRTRRERWLEVAYFWGIGGTVQAILTPDLRYGFPDIRFMSFFVGHAGIVIGIGFLMITRRYRPHFNSIGRVFAWTELYFVIALTVDRITGVNYGFLLHKPEAFSLLSYLSDTWPIYILQMHILALLFFGVLYLPFALFDLFKPEQQLAASR
jgi:hypothetical integral membrane protein (TIGR02206 family)